ncbi:peptidase M20 domain-containing protein 2-like [Saccoglossus kowalevskii]
MSTLESLTQAASDSIDKAATELNNLSQEIWKKPELNFKEYHAHQVLSDFLEKHGFNVERHYHLDTAFRATYGNEDGLNVCVICEYDALPEIGHACGHNLIAECGAGAGLGIKAAMEAAGKPMGKLTVLGTPAEEGGGGKLNLIEAGVFKDIDIAMMVHPVNRTNTVRPIALSIIQMSADFIGKAAHAAYAPWEGINALDAAVLFYQNMSVMRQQMKTTWRTHGVITNGGVKPNIIPEKTRVEYYLRTPTVSELQVLQGKAKRCAEGAALSTGCTVECKFHTQYNNIVSNRTLANIFQSHGEALGVKYIAGNIAVGSTDMGNVTYEVPGIHPMYGIPQSILFHDTGAPEAQEPTLTNAKIMAYTALEVLYRGEDIMKQIREDFKGDMKIYKE